MATRIAILALAFLALSSVAFAQGQENWPQWRGPSANGVSGAKNLPTTWSAKETIVWKATLPSWSAGTPIIWGDRIFVTSPSASEAGKAPAAQAQAGPLGGRPGGGPGQGGFGPGAGGGGFGPGPGGFGPGPGGFGPGPGGGRRGRGPGGGFGGLDPGGQKLLLICLSRKDGKQLWMRELDEGNQIYNKQNSSSPSPVTDGKHVWVVTGNGQVTAFDLDGKQIWQRNLQRDYGRFGLNWGYASSPLLYKGKLIIQVLHGMRTREPSYIVAFESLTGKPLWREVRPTDAVAESHDAYTTPALLEYGGKPQIVISGGDYVTGHDPESGKEIWRAGGINPSRQGNYRLVASPFVAGGMIYVPGGRGRGPVLALRPGGAGDVTASNLAWKWEERGAPDVPSPVCDGKYFYMVEDSGRVTCLDAQTGKVIWGPERTNDSTVRASPLLADGKLYITNDSGVTTVLAAGPQFKILATNALDGGYTLASLAVSGSRLYLRSGSELYCIGK